MMLTVPHVTSGSGLRKFRTDGFLFDRVYISIEQLCKCDFEFVTPCIYKYHNKMHQEDIRLVLNTILPSKRRFLIYF